MTKSQKIDHIQQNDGVTKIGVSFLGAEKKNLANAFWQPYCSSPNKEKTV